jgi:uncharacterized peroxidase-related enzyme
VKSFSGEGRRGHAAAAPAAVAVAQNRLCPDFRLTAVNPTVPAPSTDRIDAVDRLAGLSADDPVGALRRRRSDVRQELQACFDALFAASRRKAAQPALDRALAGLRVASLLADPALTAAYEDRARAMGASPAMLSHVSLVGEIDPQAALDVRLTAMLTFVDRLTLQPAQSTPRHLEQLMRQGLDTAAIVGLAQTAGFVTCQARLLAGLRALVSAGERGADLPPPPPDPQPGHHPVGAPPPVRGRFTVDALQWRPWLPAVEPRKASAAQRALLAETAPNARRSPYERTLLHNVTLRRPHARLVTCVSNAAGGLPIAERALAAAVVSRIDGCTYGASMLGRIFIHLTRAPEVIGTLFAQGANVPLPPRWRALADLAVELNGPRPTAQVERIQQLRAAGLSDLEILDALHAIAIAGWDHRLALTLGEAVGPGQG